MNELMQILRHHAGLYPKMEPVDAVKLIYQNEFGGGHLIRDEESCLDHLRREYASIVPNSAAEKTEDIGNGMIRVYLSPLSEAEMEQLGQDFLTSARVHHGCMDRFLEKLTVLRQLTEDGLFSFDLAALDAFLEPYCAAGCPLVSHSQTYRMAYHPAYRVICMK